MEPPPVRRASPPHSASPTRASSVAAPRARCPCISPPLYPNFVRTSARSAATLAPALPPASAEGAPPALSPCRAEGWPSCLSPPPGASPAAPAVAGRHPWCCLEPAAPRQVRPGPHSGRIASPLRILSSYFALRLVRSLFHASSTYFEIVFPLSFFA